MTEPTNLSRRQFLAHSAGLAGASLGVRVTRAEVAREPGGPVRVRIGVVGLGDRGRHLLAQAMKIDQLRVTALCDVHPRRLKRALDIARSAGTGVRGFSDCAALLTSGDIDAVVLATPVWLHAPQTIASLEAGRHVLCEKPLGVTPAECHEVLEACRRAEGRGLIYQAGLQRRYNPRYRESIRYLRRGGAGDVHLVRAQWHAVSPPRRDKPWIHQRERSGGIVLEQACHQFDIFNWVFDALPRRATGLGGCFRPGGALARADDDRLDHYGAILEYPRGAKVVLSHLTRCLPERRFGGIYELAFCERGGVDLGGALAWSAEGGAARELCRERGNETRLSLESFADCLIRGRRPDADVEVAWRAATAAFLCREAVERGRAVRLEDIVAEEA